MRVVGMINELTQPIYDTVQLAVAAGAQQVTFFAVPLNGVLAGAVLKTYAHTNLIQAGRLEKGLEITITGLSFYVRNIAAGGAAPSLVDTFAIYDHTDVNLQIGQTTFLRCVASEIPSGGASLNYFSNIAPAATEFKVTHGLSAHRNIFALAHPLILEDQESISVVCTVNAAIVAVTDIVFVLWGQLTRPVR